MVLESACVRCECTRACELVHGWVHVCANANVLMSIPREKGRDVPRGQLPASVHSSIVIPTGKLVKFKLMSQTQWVGHSSPTCLSLQVHPCKPL